MVFSSVAEPEPERNFLPYRNRNKMESKKSHNIKLCIWFPSLNKFLGSNAASIDIKKASFFNRKNVLSCFYGRNMDPELQLEPEPEP